MIAWMVYLFAVSVLLAVAARAAEAALTLHGRPVRYVWLAALAAGLLVPLVVRVAPAPAVAIVASGAPVADVPLTAVPPALLDRVTVSPAWERAAQALWLAGAVVAWAALLVWFFVVGWAPRRWPSNSLDGEDVRVSPGSGPAVFGLVRPSIVVPRWLLDCPCEVRRLALQHEREHIAARDPLLLAAGAFLAALTPWNPVAWWLMLRLRAAVELDCDRRVLRRGADVRAYGTMLLGIAGHARSPALSPALNEPAALLERRIRMMTRRSPRRPGTWTAALVATAGLAALLACEMDSPTVPAAEAAKTNVVTSDATARYRFVEGAFEADTVIHLKKLAEQATDASAQAKIRHKSEATGEYAMKLREKKLAAEGPPTLEAAGILRKMADGPLILIDGEPADKAKLGSLPPQSIGSIEVMKGAAATQLYGERGAKGVIAVFLKKQN